MRLGPLLAAGVLAAFIAFDATPVLAMRTPATDNSFIEHPALFGSRETFSLSTWRFPQWSDMVNRTRAELDAAQHVCAPRENRDCMPAEWRSLLDGLQGLDLRAKLERVNDAINRHPYVPTETNWHRPMYWETPFEFLRYGGQCQDYAITKYNLLRQAGVPADALRMVVLRDTAIGLDHAVLVAYVDGEALLLDNLTPAIVTTDSVDIYRPYYSINEDGWWLHVGGNAMTRVASAR
jgi:predicted transglutaminase-like cysteine proteinase